MKVLVTGSGGFIGCNLCLGLLHRGINVVASYHSATPLFVAELSAEEQKHLELSQGDLTDKGYVESLYGKGIEGIINAAIVTSPAKVELGWFTRMASVNVNSTLNLIDFAIHEGVMDYVYASSFSLYGTKGFKRGDKLLEDRPLSLETTYSITKRSCELLTERFANLSGAKVACARIATPYGPYERVTSSRTVMGTIYGLVKAATANKKVTVWGRDVERDWTYVEDTADAIIQLLLADKKKLRYQEYNVSSAVATTNEEVAKAVQEVYPDFEFTMTDDRDSADISVAPPCNRGIADITRISEDLGFKPAWTLKDGIAKYAEHLKRFEF